MDNIVQIDLYTRCLTNACSLTKVNIQPFLVDVFHHRLYLPFVPELEKKRPLNVTTLIPLACFKVQASKCRSSPDHPVLCLVSIFGTEKGKITLLSTPLIEICLDLCFRVNVYLKLQFDQFINWTTQVLRKLRAVALANGSLGLAYTKPTTVPKDWRWID